MMQKQVNGILLLDKPINMTSNGALQRIKRLFNAKKAGHTGSLDPLATGMLPICFGEATKFSQFLLESDKSYRVVAQIGVQTTTGDAEGEIIATQSHVHLTIPQITEALQTFIGESDQIPPMFSAIKHQGKPLYELARRGITVERKVRKIKIFSLTLDEFENNRMTFQVHCSKGTYIRTLVEDIGRKLGYGSHVVELRRIRITPYNNALMYSFQDLETILKVKGESELSTYLLPVETAVEVFPAVKLSKTATFYLQRGQAVRSSFPINGTFVRLISEAGRFIGIGEVTEDGRVKPHRLVSTQN